MIKKKLLYEHYIDKNISGFNMWEQITEQRFIRMRIILHKILYYCM